MSSTLSTTQMVARLQRKFPFGLGSTDAMDFLNEAFRKIDQMAKGGFIWQLKSANITISAGAQVAVALPSDFDPGKEAVLYGGLTVTPTATLIPYKTPKEFVNQQHFPAQQIASYSCWTFYPNFAGIGGGATTYGWTLKLAPDDAFPTPGGGITLRLYYHALGFPPFAVGTNIYFPTPDQFDSLIVDLAEAELSRVYGKAGWEKIAAQATQALSEMIDTYRTDRADLAGLADQTMQAQEKQVERSK